MESIETAREVRTAFDELDMQQLAIFARLSVTRRLEIMFDLCAFSQRMLIASERQRDPGISDSELLRRVRARIELTYGA